MCLQCDTTQKRYRVFIKYCVFSKDFRIFRTFSVFPRRQCVYTHRAGRTPVLQQNWQSSEKSQNTLFNENPASNSINIHNAYFFKPIAVRTMSKYHIQGASEKMFQSFNLPMYIYAIYINKNV